MEFVCYQRGKAQLSTPLPDLLQEHSYHMGFGDFSFTAIMKRLILPFEKLLKISMLK